MSRLASVIQVGPKCNHKYLSEGEQEVRQKRRNDLTTETDIGTVKPWAKEQVQLHQLEGARKDPLPCSSGRKAAPPAPWFSLHKIQFRLLTSRTCPVTVISKHILMVILLGVLFPFLGMLLHTHFLLSCPFLQMQHHCYLLLSWLPRLDENVPSPGLHHTWASSYCSSHKQMIHGVCVSDSPTRLSLFGAAIKSCSSLSPP